MDIFHKAVTDPKTGLRYIKLLLHNSSQRHSQKGFSNTNEKLNAKCIFQIGMRVSSNAALPYKKSSILDNAFDPEASQIEYQYRSLTEYAIGHGCAIRSQCKEGKVTIDTTFSPEVDIPVVSNQLEGNPFFENAGEEMRKGISKSLNLKNLTIWSKITKTEVLSGLKTFIESYGAWIVQQKRMAEGEPEHEGISAIFTGMQDTTHARLKNGLKLLEDNEKLIVYECFQFACSAMYIQMVTSNDPAFAKNYKDLDQIESKSNKYDSSGFF